ncbi:MAG: HNH endonuclease signature motif containing protein [Candidatus Gracilibacteria bacterium]
MEKIDEKTESLHREFSEYGRNAKEWAKRCMLLLPEIDRYKVWAKKGFGSIYEYAAKIAGLSHNQVNESLRILGKIENMPALMAVAQEKGILAVRPVATVATKETEKELAEKARNMTRNELEVYVKGGHSESGRPGAAGQPGKVSVTMVLDPAILDQMKKLKGDGEWEDVMVAFLKLREKELDEVKPEAVPSTSKHTPEPIKRFVKKRDNRKCVFPGCGRKFAELHHADGFARVGVHDPDRIFCMCEGHHDLAHRGLIENEHLAPKFWKVREKPDQTNPRFEIDQLVQKRRQNGCLIS